MDLSKLVRIVQNKPYTATSPDNCFIESIKTKKIIYDTFTQDFVRPHSTVRDVADGQLY